MINYLLQLWSGQQEVREIRAFDSQGFISYGYFDSPESASAACEKLLLSHDIYVTLNPVNPSLLARVNNRIKKSTKKGTTTSDKDITSIRYILVDIDPVRPAGISSTHKELDEAWAATKNIMSAHGKPYIQGMSGNGFHLIYPAPAGATPERIRLWLHELQSNFGTASVGVDLSVFNPARITKVLGSWARKGDNTQERQHRKSCLIETFPESKPVELPEIPAKPVAPAVTVSATQFDLDGFLSSSGIQVKETRAWQDAKLHVLAACVFDPSHKGGEAAIVQHPSGKISYQCFHNSCKGKTWQDVREAVGRPKQEKKSCCKYCSQEIAWENKTPKNLDGTSHRDSCSHWAHKRAASKEKEEKEKAESKVAYVVTENNVTHIVKGGVFFPILDFEIRIEKEILDEQGKKSYMVAAMSDDMRVPRRFEVPACSLLNHQKFREEFTSRGFRVYAELFRYFDKFLDFIRQGSRQQCFKTEVVGKLGQEFLFDNALATKDGVGNQEKYIAGRSFLQHKENGNLKKNVHLLEDVYQNEAWKAIGFSVATLFIHEIVALFSFFPILFVSGKKGSGKNTLADTIKSLFGAKLVKNFNFNSTAKSLQRSLARYSGVPLIMNEYSGTRQNNMLLRSIFDREGYQRAKTDNTNEVQGGEMNASLIALSTRAISGEYADEVISRVVMLDMDRVKKDRKGMDEIRKAMPQLSEFVPFCLKNISAESLMESIAWAKDGLSTLQVEDRMIDTYSIIIGGAKEFYQKMGLPFDIDTASIVNEMTAHQAESDHANIGQAFIDILESLVLGGGISAQIAKFDLETEQLMFSLQHAYPIVRKYAYGTGLEVPDYKTVSRCLREMGYTSQQCRILGNGKAQMVWISPFVPPKARALENEDPEPKRQTVQLHVASRKVATPRIVLEE